MIASAADLTADLYFAAALRAGADSSFTRLLPLASLPGPLAPHDRFSQRILLALQGLGYIEPELSLSQAQDWLYSRDWLSHGFENVAWRILRPPQPSTNALQHWAEGTDTTTCVLETWVSVWEDLALAEVAEYTRWSLEHAGFNPNWADQATGALMAGLEKFSAQQVMYLVYLALRSLALMHQKATARIAQLGHLFSSSISNYVQRAAAERWTIRGMTRTPDLPRSAITVLFADTVTGLGERYYSDCPSLGALVRAITSRQTLH